MEQKEQRRNEILVRALDLFVKKGYAGTKTSDIAKAVNMSDGLLFHYFPTKENLYLELVSIGVGKMNEFSYDQENDPYRVIYNIIEMFLESARSNRFTAKMFVLIDTAQNEATTPKSVYEVATQVDIMQTSIGLIEMGQEKSVFRLGDPVALSYTFWNAFQGIMQALAKYPDMPIPDVDWVMSILLK